MDDLVNPPNLPYIQGPGLLGSNNWPMLARLAAGALPYGVGPAFNLSRSLYNIADRIRFGSPNPARGTPAQAPSGGQPSDTTYMPRNLGYFGQNPGDNPEFVRWAAPEGAGPLSSNPNEPGWVGGTPFGSRLSPGQFGLTLLPGALSNIGAGSGGNLGSASNAIAALTLRHALASPEAASRLVQWNLSQGQLPGTTPVPYGQQMANWAYWQQHGLPNPAALMARPASSGTVLGHTIGQIHPQ